MCLCVAGQGGSSPSLSDSGGVGQQRAQVTGQVAVMSSDAFVCEVTMRVYLTIQDRQSDPEQSAVQFLSSYLGGCKQQPNIIEVKHRIHIFSSCADSLEQGQLAECSIHDVDEAGVCKDLGL